MWPLIRLSPQNFRLVSRERERERYEIGIEENDLVEEGVIRRLKGLKDNVKRQNPLSLPAGFPEIITTIPCTLSLSLFFLSHINLCTYVCMYICLYLCRENSIPSRVSKYFEILCNLSVGYIYIYILLPNASFFKQQQ